MAPSIMDKVIEKYFVPNRDARTMADATKLADKAKSSIHAEYRLAVYGRPWREDSARRIMLDQLKEVNLWLWKQELRLTCGCASSRAVDRY